MEIISFVLRTVSCILCGLVIGESMAGRGSGQMAMLGAAIVMLWIYTGI